MVRRCFTIFALAALAELSPAVAQVHFDVTSIHPSRPGAGPQDGHSGFVGDRFDAEAYTVGDILDMLNGWRLQRVAGGPAWMTTDRFDIHAKASAPIPPGERREAVMALLAERFSLVVHRETRNVPAMVLLAPKKPSGISESAAGETPSLRFNDRNDPTFTAQPMSTFTNYLSQMWHEPVVDLTGLEGKYDFSLSPSAVVPEPGEKWGDRVRAEVNAVGFKVEERKVPTEVTVVDRCERPTEN
ncbi:MAG TPA: TIGR03435 family protein [Bryobacteraceae bacterium]|jgi:uncharacterized protein (TIGR03435 family)|nr:TIGR03435 family protein [Bryobacteraceae bacterium]